MGMMESAAEVEGVLDLPPPDRIRSRDCPPRREGGSLVHAGEDRIVGSPQAVAQVARPGFGGISTGTSHDLQVLRGMGEAKVVLRGRESRLLRGLLRIQETQCVHEPASELHPPLLKGVGWAKVVVEKAFVID